ncbi:DUF1003 domain-containing protein [Sphingomonas sp. TZW2008]|uniref:DUF1003 domain-containing protein n=1 Tax=Sphingomonas sp. TZW2008 TaxID=1917973 RepID=UPI000A268E83|nr:DUF1003 domain-containing protein [Sphingomonas sp. TZW2008]
MHQPGTSDGMNATLRANITRLRERDAAERANAPRSARLASAITDFAGSMRFVAIHAVAYGAWIVINLGWIPAVPRFDPTFVVLAMEASVEAIFLSTFVLITQNRMAAEAERRASLDLHINLLAEHELTKVADLVVRIAAHLGVSVHDPAYDEVRQDVAPDRVLDALEDGEAP